MDISICIRYKKPTDITAVLLDINLMDIRLKKLRQKGEHTGEE